MIVGRSGGLRSVSESPIGRLESMKRHLDLYRKYETDQARDVARRI